MQLASLLWCTLSVLCCYIIMHITSKQRIETRTCSASHNSKIARKIPLPFLEPKKQTTCLEQTTKVSHRVMFSSSQLDWIGRRLYTRNIHNPCDLCSYCDAHLHCLLHEAYSSRIDSSQNINNCTLITIAT